MNFKDLSKRFISFVLAFVLLISSAPGFSLVARAEEENGEEILFSAEDNNIEKNLSLEIKLEKEQVNIDEEIEIEAIVKNNGEITNEEKIIWNIDNKEIVEYREEDNKLFIVGKEIGKIKVEVSLEDNNEIKDMIELEIVPEEKIRSKREVGSEETNIINFTEEYLNELIEESLQWTKENNSKYDFNTVATLLLAEENKDEIISKRNEHKVYFGYKGKAENIISSYILGLEPIEGYLDAVKSYDFSKEITNDTETQSAINTIVALDLLNIEYDKKIATEKIVDGIKSDKIKNEYLGQATIAIADKVENKEEIKEIIFSKITEYGEYKIIGNLKSHTLALEGLIALGEDTDSEIFQELFKTILAGEVKDGYAVMPEGQWKSDGVEAQVLELLQAMKNKEDIYKSIAKRDIEENNYSIAIDKSKTQFYENEKIKLNIKIKNEKENEEVNLPYTLSSLDETIAKVKDNEIEIVGLGKVKIKAELNGFSNISDEIEIDILEKKEDINKYIENTLGYYEKFRVKDYNSTLSYEEYTILAKIDMDLSKWKKSEDIGKNMDILAAKAQQVELYLSLGRDPREYKGRNLIDEIKIELQKGIKEEKFSQNYLDAVNALNRFNKIYKIELDENIRNTIAENLIYALADDGGFGGGPNDKNSAVPNTGRGLIALSEYRDIEGVNEAIDSSIKYLKLNLRENGRIFEKFDFTYNHTDAVRGLLAVGENLTKEDWKVNGKGPIEGMFVYKQKNNSFKQSSNSTIGSDKIATRNVLDVLLILKDLGYGNYELEGNSIEPKPEVKPEDRVITDYIKAVANYYDTEHFVKNQSTLNPRENGTLNRLNNDLSKWHRLEDLNINYDRDLKYIGNKANQIEIYLELDKDPTNFKGRNLVNEMVTQIEEGIAVHSYRSYLKAVAVLNKYSEKYPDKFIEMDTNNIVENILKMQNEDGGFKQVEDGRFDEESKGYSVVDNTGLALEALSYYSGENVYNSIQKAIGFLKNEQKDDGGFYLNTYLTIPHGQAIKGLLAVEENLRTEKWKKENNGPIEALFINWQKNNSFWNMAGESEHNRPWIEATERGLSTLIDLSEKGYNNYILKSIPIKDNEEIKPEFLKVETIISIKENGQYIPYLKEREVEIDTSKHSGFNVLGALEATTNLFTRTGSMVNSIFGIENKGNAGWIYSVNDINSNVMADKHDLKAGDKIIWYYGTMEDDGPKWKDLVGEEILPEIKITTDKSKIDINEQLELNYSITKGEEILKDKEIEFKTDRDGIVNIKVENQKLILTGLKSGEVTVTVSLKENPSIKSEYKIRVYEEKLSEIEMVLKGLRNIIGAKQNFSFREAIGYNYTSKNLNSDLNIINNKQGLRKNESSNNIAGNIISIISAGGNPYNYKGVNYVQILLDSKGENNKYMLKDSDDYSTTQAFIIIALSMANTNYDKAAARDMLLSYQVEDGSFGGTDETGMVLAALGLLEKDNELNTAVNKAVSYLKSVQLNSGGFNSPNYDKTKDINIYSTSAVIQGLISVGEDMSTWKKGGDTPVSALLKEYNISYGKEEDNMANEQIFIALADVIKNKSMFKEIKYIDRAPIKISIENFKLDRVEVGMKLPLKAKIYDENNKEIYGYNIEWSISDESKANISENIIEFLKEGKVKVTAKVKDFESIVEEKEIKILPELFTLDIIKKTEIENGKEAKIEASIKNNEQVDKEALFIIALYDKDNKMVNYSYSEKIIKANSEEILGAGFIVPKTGEYTLKTFVWDSFKDQSIRLQEPMIIKSK